MKGLSNLISESFQASPRFYRIMIALLFLGLAWEVWKQF